MMVSNKLGLAILFAVAPLFFFSSIVKARQTPGSGSANSLPVSRQLAEAQSALVHGDAKRAIAILSTYIQSHPKDTSARLFLGQAYASSGDEAQAQSEFQDVLKDSPNNIPALASSGEIYLHQGQLENAEAMLGRAVKAGARAKQVRIEWATVLARLHKFKEAQNALIGFTPPTAPEDRIAFFRLKASIASGLGDAPAAASEMEKAFALQPRAAGLGMATAMAELQARNWQRAKLVAEPIFASTHDPQAGLALLEAQLAMHQEFQSTLDSLRSIALRPGDEISFRERLAELLISSGQFASASEDLARAALLAPDRADLRYNLALAQFKAGRLDDALYSAEQCKTLGDSAELEDLLGDIQEARGDDLSAVQSYQAAVTLAPNEEKYRLALAVEFIRHKSFDPARVVLKQAEQLWPQSWRIQLALGMVEYFAGSDEDASRILLHAAELAPEPETALLYLGNIQMDRASAPAPATITRLCGYADQHAKDGKLQFYCGALLFRRDYGVQDKAHTDDILRRLRLAADLLPEDPAPHCQLGKVYRWAEQWQRARTESESCVRMDPKSADGHYRLAQIYQHLGDAERSEQQMKLYKDAAQRVADENTRRDATIKTFLYTIQGEASERK